MTPRIVTSPYLQRTPARLMNANQCAYCSHPLTKGDPRAAYRATMDHILPRSAGKIGVPNATNKRPSCYRCNQARAQFSHCSGLLVLMLEEARIQKMDPMQAAAFLGVRRTRAQRKSDKPFPRPGASAEERARRYRDVDLAITFLVRAWKEDREAKALGMPNGSAAHMRANQWRLAAMLARQDIAEKMMAGSA